MDDGSGSFLIEDIPGSEFLCDGTEATYRVHNLTDEWLVPVAMKSVLVDGALKHFLEYTFPTPRLNSPPGSYPFIVYAVSRDGRVAKKPFTFYCPPDPRQP